MNKVDNPINVLMFGFEFAPYMSGGLGVACEGLTAELIGHNINLTFVLPRTVDIKSTERLKFFFADDEEIDHSTMLVSSKDVFTKSIHQKHLSKLRMIAVASGVTSTYDSMFLNDISELTEKQRKVIYTFIASNEYEHFLQTYLGKVENSEDLFVTQVHQNNSKTLSSSIIQEVERYAANASKVASKVEHDVIHAHDWLSFGAGIEAKRLTKKPLIAHIHSTEFDRSGSNNGINQYIYEKEKIGFEESDLIIAVSNLTKDIVVNKYNIDPRKVKVIHNGNHINVSSQKLSSVKNIKIPFIDQAKKDGAKIVLYMGRLTIQKNPEMMLKAAKSVLATNNKVLFVYAGTGDMQSRLLHLTNEMGLNNNVAFAGFLSGEQRDKMYASADAFIMPSMSEPFGLVALEAQAFGAPVIISKQSGVSEVLKHALKVDFWDEHEFVNKINAVLKYPSLSESLSKNGRKETQQITWKKPAEECYKIYKKLA